MLSISPCAFFSYSVSKIDSFKLASWTAALFCIVFRWPSPGFSWRAGVIYSQPHRPCDYRGPVRSVFHVVVTGKGHKAAAFLFAQGCLFFFLSSVSSSFLFYIGVELICSDVFWVYQFSNVIPLYIEVYLVFFGFLFQKVIIVCWVELLELFTRSCLMIYDPY